MVARFFKIILVLVITAGLVGFDGRVARTDSTPTMPFVIKANDTYFYSQFENVTSKYAIFSNYAGNKLYIDLATGEKVPENKLDYASLAVDIPINSFRVDKYGQCSTSTNFADLEVIGNNLFAVGYEQGCKIAPIEPQKGIFVKSNYSTGKVTIFKINPYKELYSFYTIKESNFECTVFAKKYMIVNNSIIELESGKLLSMFSGKQWPIKYKISGDYTQIFNVILNTKTLEVVYISKRTDTPLCLSDNVCYTWWVDSNDYNKLLIESYNLETKRSHIQVIHISGNDPNRRKAGLMFGVVKGLAYFYENINGYFEVFDLTTKKEVFSVPANHTLINFTGADNDRQIVFSDGGTVYCYDVIKRVLIWKKAIITYAEFIDVGNTHLCMVPEGEDTTKIFDLDNPGKKILMKSNDLDRSSRLFYFNAGIFYTHLDGTTCSIKRYNLDGSSANLPFVIQEDIEKVKISLLMCGDKTFLAKYDYRKYDETSSTMLSLYELDGNSWKKRIEIHDFNHLISNDSFIVIMQNRKILIYNVLRHEKTTLEDTQYYSFEAIADNKIVCYNYDIRGYAIFDIIERKFTCRIENCHYIGNENSIFYFIADKKIIFVKDGIINNIENKSIDDMTHKDEIRVVGGLLFYNGKLTSLDGKTSQTLIYGFRSDLYLKDGKLSLTDYMCSLTNADVVPCSIYSLAKEGNIIKLTNTGTLPMQGRFCIVDTNNEFPAVRLENFKTFSANPGKTIDLTNIGSNRQQLLAVNCDAVLDMTRFDFKGKSSLSDTYCGTSIDFDGTAWTLSLWNKDY